jgi:hypothetical protein
MFARVCRLAAIASAVLPAALAGQGFEYAPGSAQYRVTQSSKVSQEMMGNKQEGESTLMQLLTLNIARGGKDTLQLSATIDSITASNSMGMPMPGLDKLVGIKVSSFASPGGKVYKTEGPKDLPMAEAGQIVDQIGSFLPKIRGTLAKGSSWTDTVVNKSRLFGIEADRRTVSTYTVVGDTTVSGAKAWNVERVANVVLSGSGSMQGQPVTLEGTMSGKGLLVLGQPGSFLGADGNDESNLKIVLVANGTEVNVKGVTNTKIQKVK